MPALTAVSPFSLPDGHRDASASSSAELFMPSLAEVALAFLAFSIALIGSSYGGDAAEVANYVVPVVLMLSLVTGIVTMMARNIMTIWAALLWSRVVLITYFAVGSVVPFFVNDDTRALIERFYYFFPEDMAKYNLVSCVFVLFLLAATGLTLGGVRAFLRNSGRKNLAFEPSTLDTRTLGLSLATIGLIAFQGFSLPYALGLTGGTFALIATQLTGGIYIGIFLLTYWALENRSQMIYAVFLLSAQQFAFGMLLLSKSEAMLPLIMLGIGYIFVRRSPRGGLAIALATFAIYSFISPIISDARRLAYSAGGGELTPSLAERVDALAGARAGEGASNRLDIQTGWARLSYVNGGTFAINQYDAGIPGDSLEYLPIVWIPRFVYPDKPSITQAAIDFNYAVSGTDTSAATPGMPAEGYWNFGWPGVALFGMVIGAVFTLWSVYTVGVLQSGAWHLFFIVLLGMRVGFRLDGLFVPDFVGPIGYAFVGHFGLQFLNRLIARRKTA